MWPGREKFVWLLMNVEGKMKYLIGALFLLVSCATHTLLKEEEMLADGTWKLKIMKKLSCEKNKETSLTMKDPRKAFEKDEEVEHNASCLSPYQNLAQKRGEELCLGKSFRVFGCDEAEEFQSFYVRQLVVCYIRCGEK